MTKYLLMMAGTMLVAGTASAGLLPVKVTVTPEAGNYRWSYAVVLPTDAKLQSGNYFTIYDFNGLVPGGEQAPSDWTFSSAKVGPTPDLLNPIDNAMIDNLTWTYNGATIESGQIGLGNFWAVSTFESAMDSFFTASTRRTSDGVFDNNITSTSVATGTIVTPPPAVPEPTTLALAGLGLPLIGLVRAMRKKK